jgi:hypothetical protein
MVNGHHGASGVVVVLHVILEFVNGRELVTTLNQVMMAYHVMVDIQIISRVLCLMCVKV